MGLRHHGATRNSKSWHAGKGSGDRGARGEREHWIRWVTWMRMGRSALCLSWWRRAANSRRAASTAARASGSSAAAASNSQTWRPTCAFLVRSHGSAPPSANFSRHISPAKPRRPTEQYDTTTAGTSRRSRG